MLYVELRAGSLLGDEVLLHHGWLHQEQCAGHIWAELAVASIRSENVTACGERAYTCALTPSIPCAHASINSSPCCLIPLSLTRRRRLRSLAAHICSDSCWKSIIQQLSNAALHLPPLQAYRNQERWSQMCVMRASLQQHLSCPRATSSSRLHHSRLHLVGMHW